MISSTHKRHAEGPLQIMKRADPRKSIHILVMGDGELKGREILSVSKAFLFFLSLFYSFSTAMVGKSSLISTFVSRVFSPEVPGIMTRVQLPPDPLCTTTIIDSQEADVALMEAMRGNDSMKSSSSSVSSIDHVDSIVLVYDLHRAETFRRIEQHWLPLIQQYYQGRVRAKIYIL